MKTQLIITVTHPDKYPATQFIDIAIKSMLQDINADCDEGWSVSYKDGEVYADTVDPEPRPIGMQCSISWDKEEGSQDVYISFLKGKDHDKDLLELTGLDEYGVSDDLIFYYMETEEVDALLQAVRNPLSETFSVGAGWAIDLSESWAMAYEL